ncbi:glycosyltransferase [Polynucleobacter sp. MWH-UH19D]|uniref:MraY family glycosyltransferase n=1 Tax=Polynucleobacter sp. MWH-UH19D TaxID=1855610 RepID=UPI0033650B99
MSGILLAFFTSFITTLLIIRTQRLHALYSADHDLSGPQKFHEFSVPRIGGLGIGLGIILSTALRWLGKDGQSIELIFILCAILPFGIGFAEDITKSISIRARLLSIAIGALAASHWLGAEITSLDVWGFDYVLQVPLIAMLFTTFAITGLSNAYNIIDGFNGLASMVAIMTLLALGYVGFKFNDFPLVYLSITMAAAILGFFIWNYPRGLIFLGDGGAYLIGFWIAIISILMVVRHNEISPWFALLVNGYPITETLFTIYRRKIHQGKNPGDPDGIHFHSLIFRRVLNTGGKGSAIAAQTANSKTSPFLWVLCSSAIAPGILFYQSTMMLFSFFCIYVIFYTWLYWRIVKFQTPKWFRLY